MSIDWWTLVLQTSNFLILVWLLARFLFRPIARIISERQTAAHAVLDEARDMHEAAQKERDAAQAELVAASRRRAELISEAVQAARSEGEKIVESAKSEVATMIKEGGEQIDKELADRKRVLDEQAVALAADISGRLFARLPNDARITGFIDGLVEAVAALPEATRAHLVSDGPLKLRAARLPNEAELALLREKLASALGADVAFDAIADPDLIAGLELETPHATVRNHLRADLEEIKSALVRDA